jgi:8-oxo-dGTP pyrophosphatase MutT (NUDIX family)
MNNQEKIVACIDKDGNTFDVPASELIYRPSIYGIVIKDEKMLLVPQWDGYDFPGGGMEIHETIEDALVREVWEETGYTVKPIRLVGNFDSFWKHPSTGKFYHTILMYYVCELVSGEISVENLTDYEKKFGGKAEWVSLSEIPKIVFRNSIDSHKLLESILS